MGLAVAQGHLGGVELVVCAEGVRGQWSQLAGSGRLRMAWGGLGEFGTPRQHELVDDTLVSFCGLTCCVNSVKL